MLIRAALSWCVFVLALTLAGLGSAAATSLPENVQRAIPAAITLVVAVPLVLLVCHRRRGVLALGGVSRILVGIAVVLVSSAAVLVPAAVAGWIRVNHVDWSSLLIFVLTNTALALALEAVPEELVFRGAIYGSLRTVTPRWVAALATIAAFVVAPGASIAAAAVIGRFVGLAIPPATFAPGGQNPVDYAVLLAVFGVMLIMAREATDSIWAAVGAHLCFLTVNRLAFPGGFDTGVSVVIEPGTELLVPVYLLIAIAVFIALGRARAARARDLGQPRNDRVGQTGI